MKTSRAWFVMVHARLLSGHRWVTSWAMPNAKLHARRIGPDFHCGQSALPKGGQRPRRSLRIGQESAPHGLLT